MVFWQIGHSSGSFWKEIIDIKRHLLRERLKSFLSLGISGTISGIVFTTNDDIRKNSKSTYRVVCWNSGASGLLFPAWSVANGQDDIVWYTNTGSGSNSKGSYIYGDIRKSDHNNETGWYVCDVYTTTDGTNAGTFLGGVNLHF